jgi:hypothetical protein
VFAETQKNISEAFARLTNRGRLELAQILKSTYSIKSKDVTKETLGYK